MRLLGLVEASVNGRDAALGGAKQRALLAMLALNPNAPVSADRLIEGLWGEQAPASAPKMVQLYVSQLRKLIDGGDAEILTRGRGYELRLPADAVDAVRFERLVTEAARADATPNAAAREALALWRGPPLDDIADEPFAAAEIRRLQDLWLRARELAIDDALAAGEHGVALGEIEDLVAEHPLRERLHAQRMLALYRSGRQAEALEAYRRARDVLVQEVGVEPGPELRALHEAILDQDPAVDAPPSATPAIEATRSSAFVGRERELAELVAGLDDACAGRGRLFLLAGEPGIGKSRLAEELLARARARGARALVGRCWEAGGAPAYWPWVQSLRAYARATEPGVLRSQLGGGAAELAQLMPELRELFHELPEPPAPASEGARFRLFEAATSFLCSAARTRPLVLFLDDLHAADEPSLLLLQFVAREIADSRLLVVCAFRDVDPTMRDPLTGALAQLVREPHTGQIALAGLSEHDAAQYIERSTGTVPTPQLVRAVHAETEGNPLFVVEVVRLLDGDGGVLGQDAQLRIPPGVRAVIGQRMARLSERCRSLLVAGSVMGREFGLDALAQVSGMPRDELLDALDEAMAERLVGDAPGSPGRLRFAHVLIRDTLYDELTTARRLRLHRQAGEALEAIHATDLGPHLAELAHHYLAAAPAGATEKAIAYARAAGDRAVSQLAYEEAIRLYERALTLVEAPIERCELLLALGDARARAGDTAASKQAFREAADLAERHGLVEHLARAALGYGGRIIWEVSRDDDLHAQLLERAIAAVGVGDSELRVKLLASLAGGPLRDARFPAQRRAALSAEALEIARRLGDAATMAFAIHGYILGHHSPEHTPRQLELATELIEVATRAGDKERAFDGREERLDALIELGDVDAAHAELEAMASLARELRQPSQGWLATVYRALLALLEGRVDEAESLIVEARDLGEHAQSWNAAVTYRLQLYVLRYEQGRLEEIENLVRRSVQEYPTYPIWRCVSAHMAAHLGHAAEARDALAALAVDGFAGLPFDEEWLVSVSLLAETMSRLGDAEHAPALYRLLHPYRDRIAISYPEVSAGAVSRYLGLLAATMERWDDAERHFQDAIETHERIGARTWLAHARDDLARMRRARGALT